MDESVLVAPRIKLVTWLESAYPEIYKQYLAIKDLEESVDADNPAINALIEHYKQWAKEQKRYGH